MLLHLCRIVILQHWFHERFPQLWELEFKSYLVLGDYGSLKHNYKKEIWELREEGCLMGGRAGVEVMFKK